MNQLVQSLYKASGVLNNGHDISGESLDSSQSCISEPTSTDNMDSLPSSEVYKRVQHGADIPFRGLQKSLPEKLSNFRHLTSDVIRKTLPAGKRKLDAASRRKQLEELMEQGRKEHMKLEEEKNASRKHHDYFLPDQKSPISPTRYEDVDVSFHDSLSPQINMFSSVPHNSVGSHTLSPDKQNGLQVQGKARAIYNFAAQNPRELSFKKDDILYLLHPVDNNWILGEHYGHVGIIPLNYIQILAPPTGNISATNSTGPARTKFNFCEDISVKQEQNKGNFATLLRRVDEKWSESHDRQEIFPTSYINVIQKPSAPLPSLVTTPLPVSPEMLSPANWSMSTPPCYPSPSVFSPVSSETSVSSYMQSNRFPSGSSDEFLFPEFTAFCQKEHLHLQNSIENFDLSNDSFKSSDHTIFDNCEHSSFSSVSDKKSWLHASDDNFLFQRHKALLDYTPQSEEELELRENDEIWVLGQCDDGWFLGTSERTGESGIFPGHYVHKVSHD